MNKINNHGMSMGAVMIMLIAIGMVVGSVLTLTVRTGHTQQDQYLWIEAKNAAEAATEFGFADLVKRLSANNSFPSTILAPQNSPLKLPTQFFTTFSKTGGNWNLTKIKLPEKATYDANINNPAKWNTYPTEVIGGEVPGSVWKVVDANAPGNEFDPLKGKYAYTRNIKVYGKATATDSRGRSNTAYCVQELQVRDAPLFAHAIFYNMDMEIAPGAPMTVSGPVHTNYNAYVSSQSGLNFAGPFSSAANLYWGTMGGIGKSPSAGDVSFLNISNTQTSMKQGGIWIDSTRSDFRTKASTLWSGNVLTSAMSAPKLNPVAIDDYVRDDPTTPATVDDALNYAYQLIQPTVANNGGTYNNSIETQKFSYKAGLTIEVTPGATPTYTLYYYERPSGVDKDPTYDAATHLPKKVTLTLNTSVAGNDFIKLEKYVNASGTVTSGMYDMRRGKGLNLAKVDIAKLTTILNRNDSNDWGGAAIQKPQNWWNGIVYIKYPTTGAIGNDHVDPAVSSAGNYWGAQLINGSTIPNPTYAQTNGIYGTTIATNEPLYVVGHYNADGNSATGANGAPDSANEPVAALAADAITVLSTTWLNSTSATNATSRTDAHFTEVSAAFLTGILPSDKVNNNSYSGGVENFPRFLEDWNTVDFRYRGSMVSLFESEVAKEPWGVGGDNVYRPPNRDWSFNSLFATGKYPPGTPNTRTFRRVNCQEINRARYVSEINTLHDAIGVGAPIPSQWPY